jgi:hypothetical protein
MVRLDVVVQTQANHELADVRLKPKYAQRVQGSGSTESTQIKARTQGVLRRSEPITNGKTAAVCRWKGLTLRSLHAHECGCCCFCFHNNKDGSHYQRLTIWTCGFAPTYLLCGRITWWSRNSIHKVIQYNMDNSHSHTGTGVDYPALDHQAG